MDTSKRDSIDTHSRDHEGAKLKILPFSQQCLIISQGYEQELGNCQQMQRDSIGSDNAQVFAQDARIMNLHKFAWRNAYELALECEKDD